MSFSDSIRDTVRWSSDECAFLQLKAEEGYSASEIAMALRKGFGRDFSRNAVIGRLHRMGIKSVKPDRHVVRHVKAGSAAMPAKLTPARAAISQNAVVKAVLAKPPALPVIAQSDFVCRRVSIMALQTGVCRWPLGEVGSDDFAFCGNPSDRSAVYCPNHTLIAGGSQASKEARAAAAQKFRAYSSKEARL